MSDTATAVGNPAEPAFDIDSLDPEMVDALVAGKPPAGATAPAEQQPETTPEAPAETTPEATAPETKPEETEEKDETPGEHLPKYRLKPADHLEAEVYRLRKEGVPLREAIDRVYGKPEAPKPEEKPEETPADPFAAEEAKATEQIKALEKKLEEAAEAVDVRESNRITREIGKLERTLERIADRREQAAREATAREQAEQQSKAQSKESADFQSVVEQYPALADAKSAERAKFEAYVAEKNKDPDYAPIFKSSIWRSVLAREAAARGILTPKAAPQVQPTVPPSATKPQTTGSPRPPNASTVLTTREPQTQGSFQLTKEQALADIESLDDPAIIDALIKGKPVPPPRPAKR